jgi:hypothetical protein
MVIITLSPRYLTDVDSDSNFRNIWFFTDGCHDTDGYSGVSGSKGQTLTCMSSTTDGPDYQEVPGPYTNIVTSNLDKLGMKITLWNDTSCQQLITTVDTDGCAVVPADVSYPYSSMCIRAGANLTCSHLEPHQEVQHRTQVTDSEHSAFPTEKFDFEYLGMTS